MAKKESRFLKQQKIAVGALAVVVIAIVSYLSWITVQDTPLGEFVEGEHYQVIENPRRIRSEQIEVMEFFSYACVHCYNFDPVIHAWAESQGDQINFIQMPAVASEWWRLLGRHYLTLKAMDKLDGNHIAFFRAIHDARQVFNTPEQLIAFATSTGIDRDAYLAAFNSTEVTSDLARADQMARRMRIAAVPSIVVQGKYLVQTTSQVGPRRMLDVIEYLVEQVKAEQNAG